MIWRRCYGHAASAADQCDLLDHGSPDGGASTRTSFQISVVRCAVHIAMEKRKQVLHVVSSHVLQGKRRRLDIEGLGPVRYMTISVHTTSVGLQVFRQIRNLDHFGTCTTSVHVSGVPLRYIPLRYIKSLMSCFRVAHINILKSIIIAVCQ